MLPRTLSPHLRAVLEDYGKMAFVGGPRQVGKTTLAEELRRRYERGLYFNWDIVTDQRRLIADPYFFAAESREPGRPFLVVFDEIHKYARWKNYLKGAYDRYRDEFRFLVTGSGRLDIFKKGGDSLLGRYFGLSLFPLTLGELSGRWASWDDFRRGLSAPPAPSASAREGYRALFRLGGFPEPFSRGSETFYNVWHQDHKRLLIREDIRDASNLREISLLEAMTHLLPGKVGSPLSINSLREDIGVAFETTRDWLLLLESFYYLLRIPPYARRLARALKKENKVYLYDWGELAAPGPRFENLVALHLAKAARNWRETGAGDIGLHYVRDKEKREADFLLTERDRPICLVECKTSDGPFSPSLAHFQRRLDAPIAVQLVHESGICRKTKNDGREQWVVSADRWLGLLP